VRLHSRASAIVSMLLRREHDTAAALAGDADDAQMRVLSAQRESLDALFTAMRAHCREHDVSGAFALDLVAKVRTRSPLSVVHNLMSQTELSRAVDASLVDRVAWLCALVCDWLRQYEAQLVEGDRTRAGIMFVDTCVCVHRSQRAWGDIVRQCVATKQSRNGFRRRNGVSVVGLVRVTLSAHD
jgi:hypothetical protein